MKIESRRAALGEGIVHVWHVDLAAAQVNAADMFDLLDAGERDRASRLRNAADREQFVASHGAARTLLAGYIGCDPRALRFGYGQHGKPYVVRNEGEPDLRFNLSRTTGFAIFAVADGCDVGIDIEQILHDPGLMDIALQALTQRERARLDAKPEAERTTQFFRAWTRKEAFLKACGDGLTVAPADVDTEDESGKVYVRGALQPGWRVHDVAVRLGYSAAIAAAGEHWRVMSRDFGEVVTDQGALRHEPNLSR